MIDTAEINWEDNRKMGLLKTINGVQSRGPTGGQVIKEYFVTEERNKID
jgi:hypothetical protein